jgi:hypothetical protein
MQRDRNQRELAATFNAAMEFGLSDEHCMGGSPRGRRPHACRYNCGRVPSRSDRGARTAN